LCERFGWTLDQLDEQDMPRVLQGAYAANIRAALRRVETFLHSFGKVKVGQADLEVYGWVMEQMADSRWRIADYSPRSGAERDGR